jgi:hypothetical protein
VRIPSDQQQLAERILKEKSQMNLEFGIRAFPACSDSQI